MPGTGTLVTTATIPASALLEGADAEEQREGGPDSDVDDEDVDDDYPSSNVMVSMSRCAKTN
jgi:hypothetical protein